jgi:hypothetical protein
LRSDSLAFILISHSLASFLISRISSRFLATSCEIEHWMLRQIVASHHDISNPTVRRESLSLSVNFLHVPLALGKRG